jgi:hypothetical protein
LQARQSPPTRNERHRVALNVSCWSVSWKPTSSSNVARDRGAHVGLRQRIDRGIGIARAPLAAEAVADLRQRRLRAIDVGRRLGMAVARSCPSAKSMLTVPTRLAMTTLPPRITVEK